MKSKPPLLLALDYLPQLLIEIVGSAATSTDYEVLNHHLDYWVIAVRLEQPSGSLIVKLAGRQSTMDVTFERTALIHSLIGTQTAIPTAEILAVDDSYSRFPWRYLIQRRIQGQPWAEVAPLLDGTQKQHAYRQLGQAIAELHSIQFAQFGAVSKDCENATDRTSSFVDALIQRAKRTIQRKSLREIFIELVVNRANLFVSIHQPVLCHDDLHHFNVLFRNDYDVWSLAAILDFDKAWAGHSECDLARLGFWDDMMGDGFRENYFIRHPLDEGYAQRQPILQLLWCLEYAAQTPRHLADTHRLCKQLGIAPIAL